MKECNESWQKIVEKTKIISKEIHNLTKEMEQQLSPDTKKWKEWNPRQVIMSEKRFVEFSIGKTVTLTQKSSKTSFFLPRNSSTAIVSCGT